MGKIFKKLAWLVPSMLVVTVLALFVNDIRLLHTTGRTVIPWFGVLIGFVNPPKDYFMPCGEAQVHADQTEYRIKFRHKYYGGYSVDLNFPGEMEITESINTGLSFRLSFIDASGRTLRTATVDDFVAHSDGRGSVGGSIARYEVPEDLPIEDELTLSVSIYGSSRSEFLRSHRTASLVVVKDSDE